jgi:hypothetical protein
MRRSDMFSPILAILSVTVGDGLAAEIGGLQRLDVVGASAARRCRDHLLELGVLGDEVGLGVDLDGDGGAALDATATRPSAAVRPDFLAALARPLVRSQSTAASMSPSVSVSAFLASIMPAPVDSRSSFTCAAVIAMGWLS